MGGVTVHMCQLLLHTATSQFACTVSNYGITPHDAKVSRQYGAVKNALMVCHRLK